MVANAIWQSAKTEDFSRLARYKRAWDLYEGRHPKLLPARQGLFDENVAINFVRLVVDVGVAFLFGQSGGVEFEISELATTDAEEWLRAVWESSNKDLLLQQLATNGAVCGHAFLKMVPGAPYPRLVVLDPATVAVHWEPDDFTRVRRYRIQWTGMEPDTEQMIAYRQDIERDGAFWRISDYISEGDSPAWQLRGSEIWHWDFPPIVDCQNLPLPNSYYGLSDIEDDIISLNFAINFTMSNMLRIVRYHAHPKTWARGVAAARLNVDIDEAIIFPNPEAELRTLEMQSDLASSLNIYLRLKEALHEIARVPEVATGKLDGVGALSGLALQILYQPLVHKTNLKRQTYGRLLEETNRRLLAMGGFGNDIRVANHWGEMLAADAHDIAQTALIWNQLGVSQDTILLRLGFDPDMEREKRNLRTAELGEQLLRQFDSGQ